MNLDTEIFELFKEEHLIQFSSFKIKTIGFLEQSQNVFENLRFPRYYKNLGIQFLSTLNSLPNSESQYKNLFVIGLEYYSLLEHLPPDSTFKGRDSEFINSYLCIDLHTDRILCLEAGNFYETFVNTNILFFARSLVAYKKMENRAEAHRDDDEYLERSIVDLENQLREIDPDALCSEESFWVSVINGIFG